MDDSLHTNHTNLPGSSNPLSDSEPRIAFSKRVMLSIVPSLAIFLAVSGLVLFNANSLREVVILFTGASVGKNSTFTDADNAAADKRIVSLKKKVDKFLPVGTYLIISTTENIFTLLDKSGEIIRKGICSTGSYVLLKSQDKSQEWMFSTPRGMFKIQGKIENPVWRQPDWAFVEEGRPIPAPDAQERYQTGVLGSYAMTLGHGYMLHGTLYQRFLGRPVTHGCVRLGDDDLEVIYKALPVGSQVYIY